MSVAAFAKKLVRGAFHAFGWEIYQARGGLFLVPQRAVAAAPSAGLKEAPQRLHLGCGSVKLEGYANVDIVPTVATDIVTDITSLPMIADSSIEEIRMDAVLEHLFRHQRRAALKEWYRVLKPNGVLRISWIPDFDVYADAYINRKPGILWNPMRLEEVYRGTHGDPVEWNAPEQIHKDLFTRELVKADLEAARYEVVSMENVCYRDETLAVNLNIVAKKSGR